MITTQKQLGKNYCNLWAGQLSIVKAKQRCGADQERMKEYRQPPTLTVMINSMFLPPARNLILKLHIQSLPFMQPLNTVEISNRQHQFYEILDTGHKR